MKEIRRHVRATDLFQSLDRVWEDYMQVKGGDFQAWHKALSPDEKIHWRKKFDEAQDRGEKRPEQVGYIKYILYINIINWGR